MFSSLALGGGGARGGLQVGALVALEKHRGNLIFPEGIYGCSVGSILATAIAFGMNAKQIETLYNEYFDLKRMLPPLRLTSLSELPVSKGLFSMDLIEQTIIEAFSSQGIDLRGKTIGDAQQKLFIVASNMTSQTTTLFTKNIPVLDAIKCSSCLPLVFPPQILFNQVYVDGGIFVDNLATIVPPDCLVLHISAPVDPLFPENVKTMTIANYIFNVYRGIRPKHMSSNMIWLHDTKIAVLQDLTIEQKKTLFDEGYSQTCSFLAKRFPKELK
jgi:NTE family protein